MIACIERISADHKVRTYIREYINYTDHAMKNKIFKARGEKIYDTNGDQRLRVYQEELRTLGLPSRN